MQQSLVNKESLAFSLDFKSLKKVKDILFLKLF